MTIMWELYDFLKVDEKGRFILWAGSDSKQKLTSLHSNAIALNLNEFSCFKGW